MALLRTRRLQRRASRAAAILMLAAVALVLAAGLGLPNFALPARQRCGLAGANTSRSLPCRARRCMRRAAAGTKELDTEAVGTYAVSAAVQIAAIAAFFAALDTAVTSTGAQLPDWSVFVLFFGMSLRSRIFSPLDNSRPDATKAARGETTGGFNDREMPSWTPPGIFFPIMWIVIVAPLRAASSVLVWQQVGHFCDVTILVLMFHLTVGDTWNTVNNVERRLGAAVPGVLCVWASALAAAFAYYQVSQLAGQLLLPTCLWITVAAALVTDTWRVNNSNGDEPLFPYRGEARTRFWFSAE
eukprot:TRINITY_DN78955_c0_g1_i1.p1 TRINITY_DN78955_c0_g1~~TRINITY_DN78955_c0_g1_i1.p1  ORF type:complete len:300 (+),score=54.38 TRINITY_DN78955_c0_g1_i1:15-914(+)